MATQDLIINTPWGLEGDLKAAGEKRVNIPLTVPQLPNATPVGGPVVPQGDVMDNIVKNAFSTKTKADPFASKFQDASLSDRYDGRQVYYGDYKLDPKVLDARYSKTQSYQEQAINNLQVGLANGGAMFAGTLLALPDIIKNIITGRKLSDSELNNALFDMRENVANANINFRNEQDNKTDGWNTIKNTILPSFVTGSTTGWGSIFENAMYGVGAGAGIALQEAAVSFIAPGVGNSAVLATSAAKILNNLNSIRKYGQLANRIIDTSETLAQAVRGLNQGNRLVDAAKWGYRATIGAYGEAGFEGEEARHSMRTSLTEKFRQQNGYDPTGSDLENINKLADEAANARFWANMTLLMGSNSLQMGRLFRNIDLARDATERLAQRGLKIGIDAEGKAVAKKSFELTSNWWTKGFGKYAKNTIEAIAPKVSSEFAKESISEGLEEFTQTWIDKAVNNYYTWKLDHRGQSSIDQALKSTFDGFSESWSVEGLQAFLSGAIAGVAQQAAFSLPNARKQIELHSKSKQALQDVLNEYNNFQVEDFFAASNINSLRGSITSKVKDLNANGVVDQVANVATEQNDKKIYKDLESISFYNLAKPYVLRGHADILKQQFAYSLEEMSDEQVQDVFGNDKLTRQDAITDFNKRVDTINESASQIQQAFRNPFDVRTNKNAYDIFEDDFIPEMIYLNYRTKELKSRRDDIQSTLGPYYDEFKYFADASDVESGKRYIQSQIKEHQDLLEYVKGWDTDPMKTDEYNRNRYLLKAYSEALTSLEEFEKEPSYESYNDFLDTYHEAFVSKLERDELGFFNKDEVMSKLTDFNRILGDLDTTENLLRSYMKPNGQEFFVQSFENMARREQRKRDLYNLNQALINLKPELIDKFPELSEEQIEEILLDSANVSQANTKAEKLVQEVRKEAEAVSAIQDKIRDKFISQKRGDLVEDYIQGITIDSKNETKILEDADKYLKLLNNNEFKEFRDKTFNSFVGDIQKLNPSFTGKRESDAQSEAAYNTLNRDDKIKYHEAVITYHEKLKTYPDVPKEYIKKQNEIIQSEKGIIKNLPEEQEIQTISLGSYIITKEGNKVTLTKNGETLETFRTVREARSYIEKELEKEEYRNDASVGTRDNVENKFENGYFDPETYDKDGKKIVDEKKAFQNRIAKRDLYNKLSEGRTEEEIGQAIAENLVIKKYTLDGTPGTTKIHSGPEDSGWLPQEGILRSLTADSIVINYDDTDLGLVPLQTYKDYRGGLGFMSPDFIRQQLVNEKRMKEAEIDDVIKFIGDSNYYEFLQKSVADPYVYNMLQAKKVFQFKGTPQQQLDLIEERQGIFDQLANDSLENIKRDISFKRVFTSRETKDVDVYPVEDLTYGFALLKGKEGVARNIRTFFRVPNTYEPSLESDAKVEFLQDFPTEFQSHARELINQSFTKRYSDGGDRVFDGYYMLLTDSGGIPTVLRIQNKKISSEDFYNITSQGTDFTNAMVLSDNPNIDISFTTTPEGELRVNIGDKTDESVLSFKYPLLPKGKDESKHEYRIKSIEDVENLIPTIYKELGRSQNWGNVKNKKSLRTDDLGLSLVTKTDGKPTSAKEIIATRNVTGTNPLNYRVNKIVAYKKNTTPTSISPLVSERVVETPKENPVIKETPVESTPPSVVNVDSQSVAKKMGLKIPNTISYKQVDEMIGKMPKLQSTPEQLSIAIVLGLQVRAALEKDQVYLNDFENIDLDVLDVMAQLDIVQINNAFRQQDYPHVSSKRIPYKTNVVDAQQEKTIQELIKNCFK